MRPSLLVSVSAFLFDRWRFWTRSPSTLGYHLTINHLQDLHPPFPYRVPARYGRAPSSRIPPPIKPYLRVPDAIRVIHLQARRFDTEEIVSCQIVINLHTRRLDSAQTSHWLLKGHVIYPSFLEARVIPLILAPLIRRAEKLYQTEEHERRLSRHAAAILEQLAPQVSEGTYTLLFEAFQHLEPSDHSSS